MFKQSTHARIGSDRTSLYDEITTKIISELEAGRVPWVQPWERAAAKAPLAMPKEVWSAELPASAHAQPITFEIHGRQFVLIAAGGSAKIDEESLGDAVVAYALPER